MEQWHSPHQMTHPPPITILISVGPKLEVNAIIISGQAQEVLPSWVLTLQPMGIPQLSMAPTFKDTLPCSRSQPTWMERLCTPTRETLGSLEVPLSRFKCLGSQAYMGVELPFQIVLSALIIHSTVKSKVLTTWKSMPMKTSLWQEPSMWLCTQLLSPHLLATGSPTMISTSAGLTIQEACI